MRRPPDLDALTDILCAQATAAGHRRALLIAGRQPWCLETVGRVLARSPEPRLWVGDRAIDGSETVASGGAGSVLGREFGTVVVDAFAGFDVDLFGAAAGTLRGGGLLVILAPALADWPGYPDPEHARIAVYPHRAAGVGGRFLRRLARVLATDPAVTRVEEGAPLPEPPPPEKPPAAAPATGVCRTDDQERAVEALVRVVEGHRRRPLVLTSDRGRGKSAALGIATARLLERGVDGIVVTGPSLEAVAQVFAHAGRLLPKAKSTHSRVQLGDRHAEFVPPDELFLHPRPARLLLVDEAAAIPAPILERLLDHYSRIAFATTLHGYEGTGRGFAVRFQRVLERQTPEWKALRMEAPIRWAADDPVERLVFRALLLDAAAAPDEALAGTPPQAGGVQRLERDALVEDEATLGELFGLLVTAHYRTRPLDLRHLLDGPNVSVWVLRVAGHVAATALVTEEGGFEPAVARGVWEGRIRPHGHMLPESLSAHVGIETAPQLRSARIMRIAVHPAVQGRGLGSRLLRAVADWAKAEGLDLIGSTFGATGELLRFWGRSGFSPVRASIKRGATSGTHSVMLLRPLSEAGRRLHHLARERFAAALPQMLAEPLREMDPALAAQLLPVDQPPPFLGDRQDWLDLVSFAFGRRVYEVCMAPVWRLTLAALRDPGAAALLDAPARTVLVAKVLQRRGYAESAAVCGLRGRAEVVRALRLALRPLVLHYGEPWVAAEVKRLAHGR